MSKRWIARFKDREAKPYSRHIYQDDGEDVDEQAALGAVQAWLDQKGNEGHQFLTLLSAEQMQDRATWTLISKQADWTTFEAQNDCRGKFTEPGHYPVIAISCVKHGFFTAFDVHEITRMAEAILKT